ncbi:MAG: hypothetical protein HQ542_02655 [Bacteroidia bacterium]|nr:hypothetical protein [Bacteroidia bacterium]
MKKQKAWVQIRPGYFRKPISEFEKQKITDGCQPLVEQFKIQYIRSNPDKQFNYLIDIYTRWRGNYLYFCEKYKSEGENRIADEFEVKFVRLEYIGRDKFKLSYFRHTEQWFQVATDLTLQDCLDMMREIPTFQPIG